MFDECDKDGDGEINLDEFLAAMQKFEPPAPPAPKPAIFLPN